MGLRPPGRHPNEDDGRQSRWPWYPKWGSWSSQPPIFPLGRPPSVQIWSERVPGEGEDPGTERAGSRRTRRQRSEGKPGPAPEKEASHRMGPLRTNGPASPRVLEPPRRDPAPHEGSRETLKDARRSVRIVGHVDQRKIAAFAKQRPGVQIPPCPYLKGLRATMS